MIVGFPSNDFRQELATNQEIGEFCLLTYKVEFPMVEKSSTNMGSRMSCWMLR